MPDRIGKYEIRKLLGTGAGGPVYLAIDPFGQREVALKVFHDESSHAAAALTAKVRHPHIVSVLDAGVDYLVMELVQGVPLSERLLEPQTAVEIVYKCCKALEYANGLGVSHGDFKASSVLVKSDFDIKITDFSADVVALGALLDRLLAGRMPMRGFRELMRCSGLNEFGAALAELLEPHSASKCFAAARSLRFFAGFTDPELWQVARAAQWRLYPAGTDLIREGRREDYFYVLASGFLKVAQNGKLLNAVGPGECVGEMAYARRDGRPRGATVAAVEPSWALRLRVEDVDALPEACRARFNEAFLAIMAERLAMVGGRLAA